jgi:long-subunit acyl-CoA synthetase (AMP-forming)
MTYRRQPPLKSKIADRLILSKVREAIGLDKAEICFSSAAPISRSTLDFFISLNVPLVEILGMTESTGRR